MDKKMQRDIRKVHKNMEELILVVRASGGWKHRQKIRLSDCEIERALEDCDRRLHTMAVHLLVAESMLQEPPPSLHSRWEEYQQRCKDVAAELGREGKKI